MGWVYLLGDREKEGVYKIGVTRGDVQKRIKKLQTGNSGEIFLINTYETQHPFILENMLHNKYGDKKVLNEWFELTEDEIVNFTGLCEELCGVINSLKDNYFFQKNIFKDNY